MAPENEKIQIKFTEIDIESSSDCSKDAIVLEDAANQISHQQVPVRHDEANSSLILSSNRESSATRRWLTVSFITDEKCTPNPGFGHPKHGYYWVLKTRVVLGT